MSENTDDLQKKLKNSIGHNLTGGQIGTLTTYLLLVQTLRPLYVLTTYFDTLPYGILNATLLYPRRKLSGLSQEELINGLCAALNSERKVEGWAIFTKLRVERTAIIKRLSQFLEDYERSGYQDAYLHYLFNPEDEDAKRRVLDIEADFGCHPFNLWQVYQHVSVTAEVFFEFRDAVVEQFMFMAQKSAGYYYQNRTRSISYRDLLQNVLASIAKALDRYDASKGALTSYINFWLINSQSQDKHAEGLAYDVPNSVKVSQASGNTSRVNFAVSLHKAVGEDITLEDTLVAHTPTPAQCYEQKQDEDMLLRIIKCADVGSVFRLVNGITEVFLPSELQRMQEHMQHAGIKPEAA